MNVIKQTGPQDCGLFATAYLTSVCQGEDPTEILTKWNESTLDKMLQKL